MLGGGLRPAPCKDVAHIGLDRQALEHAYIGAPGIARWNDPDRRAKGAKNDTNELSDDRSRPMPPQLYLEH